MEFTLTNAGIAAAVLAGDNGPKIDFVSFRIGSAFGYTPSPSDTGLHGSEVFSAAIHNYYVGDDPNIVLWELDMGPEAGPFGWGEVALFNAVGVCMALGARATTRLKEPGMTTRIQAKLEYNNLAALVEFPVLEVTNAKAVEIATIDQANRPLLSDSNFYLIHSYDETGRVPTLLTRHDDNTWDVPSHTIARSAPFIVASGSTTNVIQCMSLTGFATGSVPSGRWIAQFLTGALRGTARRVESFISGVSLTTETHFGGAPSPGDLFQLYRGSRALSGGTNAGLLGEIKVMMTPVVPAGCLALNGQEFDITYYVDLFDLIGTYCSAGSGPNFRRLPDMRADFLRMADQGRNVDFARAFGSSQLDALQQIIGFLGVDDRVLNNNAARGAFTGTGNPTAEALAPPWNAPNVDTTSSGGDGIVRYIKFDSGLSTRAAPETRPRNWAVNFCVVALSGNETGTQPAANPPGPPAAGPTLTPVVRSYPIGIAQAVGAGTIIVTSSSAISGVTLSSGTVPPGLSLSFSGVNVYLSGTPAGPIGPYSIVLAVVTAAGTGGVTCTGTVVATTPVATPFNTVIALLNPLSGVPAEGAVIAQCNLSITSISLISGSYPPGITAVPSGVYACPAGTPTVIGIYTFTYRLNTISGFVDVTSSIEVYDAGGGGGGGGD
jgi:microcystin-dependent protein